MEEYEDHTEHTRENIMEHAAEGSEHQKLVSKIALSSAIFAVAAAVTSLLAGTYANEAMLDQIKGSDQWNFYQAKGIKAAVLASKMDILRGMGKSVSPEDEKKIEDYKREQDEIKEKAQESEKESSHHMVKHETFARGVTLFQVAIGLSAVSILTKRKKLWFASLSFGVVGVYFLVQGLLG